MAKQFVFNPFTSDFDTIDPTLLSMGEVVSEPTGFPAGVGGGPTTDVTLSFVDGTRTFTVAPSGASFFFYVKGKKFTKTSSENVVIPDVLGFHFIYYDEDGVLGTTQHETSLNFIERALVGGVYWNSTNGESIYNAPETHGYLMPGAVHVYNHFFFGAQWYSGGELLNINADASGNLDSSAYFDCADTIIFDEDLRFNITDGSPQTLTGPGQFPVYYPTGASGEWDKDTATNFPVKTFPGSGLLAYVTFTGGTWTQTDVGNNNYVLTHIFATNNTTEPIIAIQGQASYSTINDARIGASTEIRDLYITGLPGPELTPLGSVIYQTAGSYTNTPKARIRTTDLGTDYVDWRTALRFTGGSGGSGEANTASNQGVGGVGLYNTKVGVDLQFKNINAGSNKITVTDDAVNTEVDIDVDESNVDHDNLLNTHNLTTDIDHDQLTNTHNLTTDIDHDQLTNFLTSEHFTEASIDHLNIQNIGTNAHSAIDTHIADGTIHFLEGAIDHTNILNIGTNTHAQIDTHIADSTIHFTESSIDHLNISNIGTNSHATIDTHIADGTIHFTAASLGLTGLTDERLLRADGTSSLQDSAVALTDAGAMSGLTQLDVDNVQVDGNSIISTDTNGDLNLTPDGTGDLVLDGVNWPQSDATIVNQYLSSDSAGQAAWTNPQNFLTVGQSGCNFTDVQAAINYAVTQSPTISDQWAIKVYPGTYDFGSSTLSMASYVHVSSASSNIFDTIFTSSNTTATVTMPNAAAPSFCAIEGINIQNTSTTSGSCIYVPDGIVTIKDCFLSRSSSTGDAYGEGILCTGNSVSIIQANRFAVSFTGNGGTTGNNVSGVNVTGNATAAILTCSMNISTNEPNDNIFALIESSGSTASTFMQNCESVITATNVAYFAIAAAYISFGTGTDKSIVANVFDIQNTGGGAGGSAYAFYMFTGSSQQVFAAGNTFKVSGFNVMLPTFIFGGTDRLVLSHNTMQGFSSNATSSTVIQHTSDIDGLHINDDTKQFYGIDDDAYINYDGTNLNIKSDNFGSGYVNIDGDAKINDLLTLGSAASTGTGRPLNLEHTFTDTSGGLYNIWCNNFASPGSASTAIYYGIGGYVSTTTTNTSGGQAQGLAFGAFNTLSTASLSAAYGMRIFGWAGFSATSTATNVYAAFFRAWEHFGTCTFNYTNSYGVYIANPTNPGGTKTNLTQLYIEQPNRATTNSAIRIAGTGTNSAIEFANKSARIYATNTSGYMQIGCTRLGFFNVTPIARPNYTVTNVTPDRTYDANSTSIAELADVLGTLIADLTSYGLLQ